MLLLGRRGYLARNGTHPTAQAPVPDGTSSHAITDAEAFAAHQRIVNVSRDADKAKGSAEARVSIRTSRPWPAKKTITDLMLSGARQITSASARDRQWLRPHVRPQKWGLHGKVGPLYYLRSEPRKRRQRGLQERLYGGLRRLGNNNTFQHFPACGLCFRLGRISLAAFAQDEAAEFADFPTEAKAWAGS